MSGNNKLYRLRELLDTLEVDVAAFNEHRINLQHKTNVNGFWKMFQGGEAELHAAVAHNAHENVAHTQEGGVALLSFGGLINYYDGSAKDPPGLRADRMATRFVSAYNPCYNSKQNSCTSYQQQRRYWINHHQDLCCPRSKFRDDLISQLIEWRSQGDRLILCMDANENIYTKSLGKTLTDPEGLAMIEAVGDFTRKPLQSTYFRGSKPIDAVWTTPDITITGACVMPSGYGVGDHRMFVIDIDTTSVIGEQPKKVIRPAARRLNTRLPHVLEKYNATVTALFKRHQIIEKLESISAGKYKSLKNTATALNRLDKESAAYMKAAEKRCRKIKSGLIPFSPDAVKWIRQKMVYNSLLLLRQGRKKNKGNITRMACGVGISRPMHLTVEEIRTGLRVCKTKCKDLRKTGWLLRRQHLKARCDSARAQEDHLALRNILAIIRRERDKSFWSRLRCALGKKRGRSVSLVQVEQPHSGVQEYTSREGVQEAIFREIHRKRFFLVEEAPICQGTLREDFGYLARLATAEAILEGTYNFTPHFDQATKDLCMECARIRSMIPKNLVSPIITADTWR